MLILLLAGHLLAKWRMRARTSSIAGPCEDLTASAKPGLNRRINGQMTAENRPAAPAHWRPMRAEDLPAIKQISDEVHRTYSEDEATYAERLKLYPAGCFTLEQGGTVIGYVASHPWHRGQSPALNELLGAIPTDGAEYYLHDIALLPAARGLGLGEAALKRVVDHAREHGFQTITLVAVNGAETYWSSRGFNLCEGAESGASYGAGTYRMRLDIAGAPPCG
jgi:GNAT superfamily N-acetyltransferase